MADEDGHIVSEYKEDRSGESWDLGVVILSPEDAVEHAFARGLQRGVSHEFAHQLDMENGAMDGFPRLKSREERDARGAFSAAYDFERAAYSNRRTLVDPYARATGPVLRGRDREFFERPLALALRREYAGLYDVLARYYHVDPARRQTVGTGGNARDAVAPARCPAPRGRRPRPRRSP